MTHVDLAAAKQALLGNDLAKAEALVRARLEREPDNVEALRLLAHIAASAGFENDAEQLLRDAIRLAPASVQAYIDLGSLLCRAERPGDAIALLDVAISRYPDAIWPLSIKAAILSAERLTEESLALHAELVARAKNVAIPWFNYGHALAATGRPGDASDAYRTALGIEPDNGYAWLGLANLPTVKMGPNDIDLMFKAISRQSELPQRAQLHFALGKALSDHGRFDLSFEQYKTGNELRQGVTAYQPKATSDLVKRVEKLFDSQFFADRAGFGCSAPDPIFIVGMPRTGSTLIEQILASHPMVEGCGELFELQNLVGRLMGPAVPQDKWPEILAGLDAVSLQDLGQRYLGSVRRHRRTNRPYFTDKMPANWRYLGLIRAILPGAKIIDVRREAMACCFSAFTTYFSRETSFPTSLEDLGHYYADCRDMADHIDKVLPRRLHRVQYELIVSDLEGEVRRLLDYLQLPFDPACLRFHENPRTIHTPSAQQVRRPIDTAGVERWRNFAPWLEPLQGVLRSRGRLSSH